MNALDQENEKNKKIIRQLKKKISNQPEQSASSQIN